MLCCESTTDERSAGNPHATFCGSRGLGPRRPGGCGNGVRARVLGHRQTKGAATDNPNLRSPRHISTLSTPGIDPIGRLPAKTSPSQSTPDFPHCGHPQLVAPRSCARNTHSSADGLSRSRSSLLACCGLTRMTLNAIRLWSNEISNRHQLKPLCDSGRCARLHSSSRGSPARADASPKA